ncbi:hypothetical protein X943_003912 [Babesia divergens]|uniref:U3 small nucleolar RNA-associated protein 25 n=1 Tax=Babesia divergens TaxID=32595 RepID=A0AAD9LLC2_BABDI|nr:hypothetical protein X943_003912 [Babesia divergens]
MEDNTSAAEPPSAFDQLLQVLGRGDVARKIRKLETQGDSKTDLEGILAASYSADDQSDAEEFSEEACAGIRTDASESFDMSYEDYLAATAPIAADSALPLPFFKSHKFRFLTPVLNELLKSSTLPNVFSAGNPFGIHTSVFKKLSKLNRSRETASFVPKDRCRLRYLFNCLSSYVDVFYAGCKVGDLASVRFLFALHASNHVSKAVTSTVEKSHGFTRPRVLYICGLKSNARDFIHHLTTLLSVKKGDPKYSKFCEEYDLPEEDAEEQRASFRKTNKSFDFVETFSGNQDDAFKMGLRYQGGMLHLYTPFYTSDIIVASPLGLNIMLQEDDYDFLSSIEVLLIDRLDVVKFQNWRFLLDVVEKTNLPLKKWRDADINRLRVSTIDGQIKMYRQTVAVSCTNHCVFNAFFRRFENRRGFIKLACMPTTDFVLLGSQLKLQQLFINVAASSVKDADGELMKYFVKNMLSSIHGIGGVLIVLGDYTHFLRMHNELRAANFEYLPCHESCTNKQMLFARQQFQAGNAPVIVTTSRMLFFKRYIIKGTSRVFFVIPPEYPEIYREMFKMVDLSKRNSIVTLYTRFHANQLEPIVGHDKLQKLLSAGDTKVTQFH